MLIGKNKFKMYKKALCLIFAFLLSIESFAAVVSDNDGSAFVTKAEFEALKKDFTKQIDNYNQSIDGKIDGAISSYLAGLSTKQKTNERFPVAAGQKLLICNSRYVDDMDFGKVGIDWSFLLDLCHRSVPGNNNAGHIGMQRTGTNAYEGFIYNEKTNKFLYYGNKLRIDTKCVYTMLRPITAGLANRTTFTDFKLRWGGNAYEAADEGRADTIDSAGSTLWHDQFGHNRFYAFYATFLNFGTNFRGGASNWNDCMIDNNSSVTIDGDKIKWIFDASDVKSTVWARDPVASPSCLNRLVQPNYKTTNREYAYPSTAGITTTAQVDSVDRWIDSGSQQRYLTYDGNVTWVNYGRYNSESTSYANTSKKWTELHLETNEKDPKLMINDNFTPVLLNEYSGYDFHGYLTEGIPLGIFKEESKIKFKLDTTSITTDVSFAVNNKGFSTDDIRNIGTIKGLSLSVDGVTHTGAVVDLTNDKIHTIEIATEDKTAIFCKMAIHSDDTSNRKKRFIITWPETYELTSY